MQRNIQNYLWSGDTSFTCIHVIRTFSAVPRVSTVDNYSCELGIHFGFPILVESSDNSLSLRAVGTRRIGYPNKEERHQLLMYRVLCVGVCVCVGRRTNSHCEQGCVNITLVLCCTVCHCVPLCVSTQCTCISACMCVCMCERGKERERERERERDYIVDKERGRRGERISPCTCTLYMVLYRK